jgi:hypothetical protein
MWERYTVVKFTVEHKNVQSRESQNKGRRNAIAACPAKKKLIINTPARAIACISCPVRIQRCNHGQINYYRNQSKMSSYKKNWSVKGLIGRCSSEFTDWRYSKSFWYFRPSFVNCCPSNLLSCSTLPPLPLRCVTKYTVYTYTVCGSGYGVLDLRQIDHCRKIPLQVNFFRWRHFALPSMSLIFLRVQLKGMYLLTRGTIAHFKKNLFGLIRQMCKFMSHKHWVWYYIPFYRNADIKLHSIARLKIVKRGLNKFFLIQIKAIYSTCTKTVHVL